MKVHSMVFQVLMLVGTAMGCNALAQTPPSVPDIQRMESGDFLWPRPENAWVPYANPANADYSSDCDAWQRERDAFVRRTKADAKAPIPLVNFAIKLEQMSCDEFRAMYLGGVEPGTVAAYGANLPIYVGHVGIVRINGGKVTVIEAMMGKGVREISYDDWLKERPGQLIWLARLKDVGAADRARIAEQALKRVGIPYDFWNFDLLDTSGYYCSKLAWAATYEVLGLAIDGNPNARRYIWYSPKQMIGSPKLQMIYNPGSYGG